MTNTLIAREKLLELTADIISSHVSNNHVPTSSLAEIIETVFGKLASLQKPAEELIDPPKPAVPVKKSITNDYLICLEDGKKMKMLKRHLRTAYDMTPEDYRAKWNLPYDYPMVAPAYAKKRQALAKKIGLGRKPSGAAKPKGRAKKR